MLELPDTLAAATTPEGLRRVRAFIEAEFGDETSLPTLNPAHLTAEDEAALDEAYEAIRQGRVHSFDPKAAHARAQELLNGSATPGDNRR